jgi:hypothetical protein
MYCPLCKAEYREGFNRCSDCKIDLVSTYEEAQAVKVVQLWEGMWLSKFNAIVGVLDDANIPNHIESSGTTPESERGFWSHIARIGLLGRGINPNQNMAWRVFVLESDYIAAKAAVEKTLGSSGAG